MNGLFRYAVAVFTAAALFSALGTYAQAQDVDQSVSFLLSHTDNGGCAVPANVATGTFDRSGGDFEAHASVNVAPTGGDCTVRGVAYGIELESEFNDRWIAKFVADRRDVAAPYALADSMGNVVTRDSDGMALFPTHLPAGAAETVVAALGVSFDVGSGEIDLGANIVPVDWADGTKGNTLHIGVSQEVGDFAFALNADVGADSFGDLRLNWTRGFATCEVTYAFGLNAVDNGAPPMAYVGEAMTPFTKVGAPNNTSRRAGCGVSFAL